MEAYPRREGLDDPTRYQNTVPSRRIGEVLVFCTLALLGGGLFALVAFTDVYWFYPTVFYGLLTYLAWQRYFDPRDGGADVPSYHRAVRTVVVEDTDSPYQNERKGAEWSLVDLKGLDLSGSDLSEADLRHARMYGTKLRKADLKGADLSYADLEYADLTGASLVEVDAIGADFSGADLTDADLACANLGGANLVSAVVSPKQLDKCKSLAGAIMPNGALHK